MPRPGFYNDNEYRAYPFIFKRGANTLPTSAIVDCGIIMGLDSEFDSQQHSVWLAAVRRAANTFSFEFNTDAPGATNTPLVFTRNVDANEWLSENAESAPYIKDENSCATEPAWSGFLVTGPLKDLRDVLPAGGEILCARNYVLEPARVQSLVRSYLRSISVGNLSRPVASSLCDEEQFLPPRVIINKKCLAGEIRFKEGYNAQIKQRKLTNEISISAGRGLGLQYDADICTHKGEIPFYDGEQPIAGSQFLSGGPACDELVASINGVVGPEVSIVGGSGVKVTRDENNPHAILVTISSITNAGNC